MWNHKPHFFFLFLATIYIARKKRKAKIIPFTYPPGLGTMSLGETNHERTRLQQIMPSQKILRFTHHHKVGWDWTAQCQHPFPTDFISDKLPQQIRNLICPWLWIGCVRSGTLFTPWSMGEVLSVNKCESVG